VFNWIAGDDWRYFIRLTDNNDEPYNIDDLTEIKWLIHSPMGEIVEHEYNRQTIDSADGQISIHIPHDETTYFPSGVYADWLRIKCGAAPGIVSTLLTGPISVTADPWRAKVAEMPRMARRSQASVVIMLDRRERIMRQPIPEVASNENAVIKRLMKG
jgi:hypothetical protein